MLTIQPNFTNYSSKPVFKGDAFALDEQGYKKEKDYYKKKSEEFDRIMNDDYLPKTAKKGAKIFKIVSEGILKGMAVAWGASVSASMLKKLKTDKLSKWFNKVAQPAAEKLKSVGQLLGEKVSQGYKAFTKTDFAKNIENKFTNLVERLNKNEIGQYVLKGAKYLKKGIVWGANVIRKGIKAIVKPFKDLTYDKAAKTVSTTLGVGSGLAGAYEAARQDSAVDINDVEDDILEGDE